MAAFGRSSQLLFVCLDEGCVSICKGLSASFYAGFSTKQFQLGFVKLASIETAVRAGFSTMVFDLDVFFLQDPMTGMGLDTNTDIEFQTDCLTCKNNVNFGFFLSSASRKAVAFWSDTVHRWTMHPAWDQKVVNELLNDEVYRAHWDLSVKVLPSEIYINLMHFDWHKLYHEDDTKMMDTWRSVSVLMHATCVKGAHNKIWLAKTLGFWDDTRSYYTSFPYTKKLISLSGISFLESASQTENMRWATLLLKLIGETRHNLIFMPPKYVNFHSDDRLFNQTFHFAVDVNTLEKYLTARGMVLVDPFYLHHWENWFLYSTESKPALFKTAHLDLNSFSNFSTAMNSLADLVAGDISHIHIVGLDGKLFPDEVSEGPPDGFLCKNMAVEKYDVCLRECK